MSSPWQRILTAAKDVLEYQHWMFEVNRHSGHGSIPRHVHFTKRAVK